MEIILVALVAYLAYSSGLFGPKAASSSGPPVLVVPPNTAALQAQAVTNTAVATGIRTALNAIPVAGPAISAAFKAMSSVLLAASAARAKAATTENAAGAAGIPGWDTAVGQIAVAYNSGSFSYTQAQS